MHEGVFYMAGLPPLPANPSPAPLGTTFMLNITSSMGGSHRAPQVQEVCKSDTAETKGGTKPGSSCSLASLTRTTGGNGRGAEAVRDRTTGLEVGGKTCRARHHHSETIIFQSQVQLPWVVHSLPCASTPRPAAIQAGHPSDQAANPRQSPCPLQSSSSSAR